MPGSPSDAAQAIDRGRDDAEVLGDDRQLPELRLRRRERRAPRAALPAAAERVAGAARHRPVGDEAAEVVDPGEVEERERARQPRDPPGVAPPLQRGPVVERIAPQLALRRERVGRRARHRVRAEQLGMRAVVGRPGRDVDRDVADQPHAALGGVRTQAAPLAVEAHLVGDGAAPREAHPVVDPARLALAEVELLALGHPRRGLRQQPGPGREGRARLVRRAVAIGRAERQHLPPGLAGVREPVDPRVGRGAQAAARERGRMQLHSRVTSPKHDGGQLSGRDDGRRPACGGETQA